MKFVVLTLLLLALSGCGCSTPRHIFKAEHTSQATHILKLISDSAVTIETSDGLGSGAVIYSSKNGSLILTCDHVVGDDKEAEIILSNADKKIHLTAEVYKKDRAKDLALLYTTSDNLPVLRVASEDPALYSMVYSVASPAGLEKSASRGFLSQKRHELTFEADHPRNNKFAWLITEIFGYPGASGGAIVNESGDIVCVTEAVPMKMYNVFPSGFVALPISQAVLCITREEIAEFLKGIAL